MKKYNTRTIAELEVSQDIILSIINNKNIFEDNNIFLQDSINNESVIQVELVISDFCLKDSDNLILQMIKISQESFTVEIVEIVSTIIQAIEDGFDNLLIYNR